MSDPDPDADLEHLRTTLQHARDDAPRDIATTLDDLTDSLGGSTPTLTPPHRTTSNPFAGNSLASKNRPRATRENDSNAPGTNSGRS